MPSNPSRPVEIRVVQLKSRNPLVGALFLIVLLALVAFLLTAGLALAAGGALVGGAAYALRRVFGGKRLGGDPAGAHRGGHATTGDPGLEVFAPSRDVAGLPSADVTSTVSSPVTGPVTGPVSGPGTTPLPCGDGAP
ncbi:MAG TPA: hypothetical protein VFV33_27635 [Gemmatimonadaceae bacterium]|nr:hypothetical protein [Gemmatimonadaceae bacterium]